MSAAGNSLLKQNAYFIYLKTLYYVQTSAFTLPVFLSIRPSFVSVTMSSCLLLHLASHYIKKFDWRTIFNI